MNGRSWWCFTVIATCACENAGAPAVLTPEDLCAHYDETGCLEGTTEDCVAGYTPDPTLEGSCQGERNELRRCYWLDLPANADTELATDPFDCVLSSACENESHALCFCERAFDCYEAQ